MEIIQFIRAFVRRWWLFVICGVAGLMLAYALSTAVTKRFESTVTLQLNPSARGGFLPFSADALTGGSGSVTGLAASYTEVLRSRSFGQLVVDKLNLGVAPEAISQAVTARLIPSTNILRLTVDWDNPDDATTLAQSVAELFISENLRRQQDQPGAQSELAEMEQILSGYPARLEALHQQRDKIDQAVARGDLSRLNELNVLDTRLSSLETAYTTLVVSIQQARSQLDTASVLDGATPAKAVGPLSLERALPLGLLSGIAAAIALALFLDSLDDTIRSPSDIADVVESGPLGVIGRVRAKGWRGVARHSRLVTLHASRSGPAEAFRTLRANLRFLGMEEPIRSLVVTSGSANEGKTLVASNLAIAFAQAGDRVLLVDADLRRPSMHDEFGISGVPGLGELLMQRESAEARGQAPVAAPRLSTATPMAVQAQAIADPAGAPVTDPALAPFPGTAPEIGISRVLLDPLPGVVPTDVENLWILPAGSVVRDPTRLLDSRAMSRLLEEMSRRWDMVLFDTAPVGPVADTLALAARASATLLVTRSDRTRHNQMESTLDALQKTGRPVIGVVFNDYNPDLFSRYTPYASYYHYYGYGGHEEGNGTSTNGHV